MAYPNPNYVGQNMYYPQFQGNIYNPHPSYFANAMQQNYNPQPQQQPQQTQNQQRENITTQPLIMQPQINSISKIIPVLTKEEATGSPVDLVNGTPSFFYNKSNGEIYFKQFDVPNGLAIFKTYLEVKEPEKKEEQIIKPDYEGELRYISEGVDNLHRILAQMQNEYRQQRPISVEADVIDIEPDEVEIKKVKGKKHA
jgi:hypothetical protein